MSGVVCQTKGALRWSVVPIDVTRRTKAPKVSLGAARPHINSMFWSSFSGMDLIGASRPKSDTAFGALVLRVSPKKTALSTPHDRLK
ncbi:MAG: hypothetical protein IPG54_13150 [Sphingomonadales bacterium]|jgi:hypothetical protein|nr:hypothetical protein [Sphingomonadales bacterium]MBK9004632.1 hypothetical protein [Sphingomonadales bacterium]MBK9269814.1 hypothetical protein [Sphingomonadales bacterium]MBP6434383.1 hypothetical protein [Sphingorhabdus sp.]